MLCHKSKVQWAIYLLLGSYVYFGDVFLWDWYSERASQKEHHWTLTFSEQYGSTIIEQFSQFWDSDIKTLNQFSSVFCFVFFSTSFHHIVIVFLPILFCNFPHLLRRTKFQFASVKLRSFFAQSSKTMCISHKLSSFWFNIQILHRRK